MHRPHEEEVLSNTNGPAEGCQAFHPTRGTRRSQQTSQGIPEEEELKIVL